MSPIDLTGIISTRSVDNDRKTGSARTETQGAGNTQRRSPVLADDSVELTDTASRLGQLADEVRAAEGVDTQRVEALRERIASGDYEIDAGRIADRLIALEREFG